MTEEKDFARLGLRANDRLPATASTTEVKPSNKQWMTPDGLREMLRSLVAYEGGQRPLARRLGVSDPYLSDVLHARREPGGKLLKALGCRRVVIYEVNSGEADD